MPVWLLAFAVAVVLTLVITPLSRRLALATDLVDKPGQHKSHARPTPYLGGIGLIASVLVALGLDRHADPRVASIALGGAVIGTLGLLDDDRTLDPRLRFLTELAVAAVVTSFGLRIHASGVVAIDVALTLLWLVGVTNAFNLLDNMDGLAAGVAAAAAFAVFALAIMAIQPLVAALAAAVVGACLAFLVYNRPPASIFMGDAGSLFLGFVLAVLTISVTPAVDPPFSFAVPLMLLALPVLDTSTVTFARLRRRVSVSQGGKDHLSHRLVALGLSRSRAVASLVLVEAMMGLLAVLAGRRVLQLRWTILGAIVVLSLLAIVTSRATVYPQPVVGLPRRVRLAMAALFAGAVVTAAPATVAMLSAGSTLGAGVEAAESALDSMSGPTASGAQAEFDRAAASFRAADRKLQGPLVSLGLAVPGVSSNLQASRTLASIGERLSTAGASAAAVADGRTLRVAAGAASTEALSQLSATLAGAVDTLRGAHDRLTDLDQPFLVPSLERAVRETDFRLQREADALQQAATSAALMREVLGAASTRRYLVAFQDDAELRATGGVIRGWAELVAEAGRVGLAGAGTVQDLAGGAAGARVQDPSQAWEAVNTSPHFPAAARTIAGLYSQSAGHQVDGVVAVDTAGLAALLELTGPVEITGRSQVVDSRNVTETMRMAVAGGGDAADDERLAGNILASALTALTTRDLVDARNVVGRLRTAAKEQHLLFYLARGNEESVLRDLAVDGSLRPVEGDSLLVLNQSTGRSEPAMWLRRVVRYDVLLRPDDRTVEVVGRLNVGLFPAAAGQAQERPTELSVYSPFHLVSAMVDGLGAGFRTRPDLGRQLHSTTVELSPGQSRTVELEMRGRLSLAPDGWYRLDVLRQPSVPEDTHVTVRVPKGWRIKAARGLDVVDGGNAGTRSSASGRPLFLRLERTGPGRIWDRLTRS